MALNEIEKKEIEKLVQDLAAKFKLKNVTMTFKKTGNSNAWLWRNYITLNENNTLSSMRCTACHEVAHLVDNQLRGTSDHGYEFHLAEIEVCAVIGVRPIYRRMRANEYAKIHIDIATGATLRTHQTKWLWNGFRLVRNIKVSGVAATVVCANNETIASNFTSSREWLREAKRRGALNVTEAIALMGEPKWSINTLRTAWYGMIKKEI